MGGAQNHHFMGELAEHLPHYCPSKTVLRAIWQYSVCIFTIRSIHVAQIQRSHFHCFFHVTSTSIVRTCWTRHFDELIQSAINGGGIISKLRWRYQKTLSVADYFEYVKFSELYSTAVCLEYLFILEIFWDMTIENMTFTILNRHIVETAF
jgi:hypothetical protein